MVGSESKEAGERGGQAMRPRVPPITEAAFLRQVLDLAKLRGWRTAHFRPAQTSRGWRTAVQGDGAGFPDLVGRRGW
jgi:hypothetical protein